MVALSVLDIVPVSEGSTPNDALRSTLALARTAEQHGYRRYWIAEHHNMVGAAGAATGTVIGFVAAGTKTIRVGAGGIMLPNHAPLVVAEQFGTLEALYPGRIDLGLGRAPGTDQFTARALRRDSGRAQEFPQEVMELQGLFAPAQPSQLVQAVPGAGLNVPIWILGSSTSGARVAASMGLPFAFASHFAPAELMNALREYRSNFSAPGDGFKPYVMIGVNVILADTQEEAVRQFTSVQQRFLNIIRGTPRKLPAPVDNIDLIWSNEEAERVSAMLEYSFVGTPETVRERLEQFVRTTGADELIVSATLHDPAARRRSYELLASLWKDTSLHG
jgi:luciferase family oxidoreductase group 1